MGLIPALVLAAFAWHFGLIWLAWVLICLGVLALIGQIFIAIAS